METKSEAQDSKRSQVLRSFLCYFAPAKMVLVFCEVLIPIQKAKGKEGLVFSVVLNFNCFLLL